MKKTIKKPVTVDTESGARVFFCVWGIVLLFAALLVVNNLVNYPAMYQKACVLTESKDYDEAIILYEDLGDYLDSKDLLISAEELKAAENASEE